MHKQELLESRLVKMEAVLMFDDKDFEAHTGVDVVECEADTDASPGETQPSDDGAVSKQSD